MLTGASGGVGHYLTELSAANGAQVTAVTRLRPGGAVLWYGQAGLEPATLDFFDLTRVTPFTLRHFPHWESDTTDARDLATLVRLTAAGRLHPQIGRVTSWTGTPAVLDDLYHRRISGNAVLRVTQDAAA